MKNFITNFSRIFVGVLFIISGLIKLNDPVGFSYKLAEYFSEPVFNMPFFVPYALALAYIIVIVEVLLGVALLLAYYTRWTIWLLLLLIIKFSFLTFYSAYFNVVKDCGCFGDALHLTPWESFTKDIVLLVFILVLFFTTKNIRPIFSQKINHILFSISFALSLFMGYWVFEHLPIIDFRPFKVGNNIKKGMEIPEGAPKSVVEMNFIYNVNGKNVSFKENELDKIPAGATFVDRKDEVIVEGYVPPIHDFVMEKDGMDHKDELLDESRVIMVVAYDLKLASPEGLAKLKDLSNRAKVKGYKLIGMTASDVDSIEQMKQKYQLDFDFYFCDAIPLKTIERANPSIVILDRGTVIQKVHHNDLDKLKL